MDHEDAYFGADETYFTVAYDVRRRRWRLDVTRVRSRLLRTLSVETAKGQEQFLILGDELRAASQHPTCRMLSRATAALRQRRNDP